MHVGQQATQPLLNPQQIPPHLLGNAAAQQNNNKGPQQFVGGQPGSSQAFNQLMGNNQDGGTPYKFS